MLSCFCKNHSGYCVENTQKRESMKARKFIKRAGTLQARDDGGLDQGGGNGVGMSSYCGYSKGTAYRIC